MLYDNALLCYAYLEAYQCTGNHDFSRIAQEILTYVERDMLQPDGGFYSAEDADSEGVEGKFYVWSRQEVIQILGDEEGNLLSDVYGISEQGNFEHGTSILNLIAADIPQYAAQINCDETALKERLDIMRSRLFNVRDGRVHPFKDDKVLTAWNGLMIAAFAKAARVLDQPDYAVTAERAMAFIEDKLVGKDGRLLARYRDGEAAHLAYLDDYAFILWALLELYETTFSLRYLTRAMTISQAMKKLFWDDKNGAFFFYGNDSEELISRPKELYDGAIPSGNSVAALALLKLARITDEAQLAGMTEKMLHFFAGEAERYPRAYTYFLMAVESYFAPPRHIIIVGNKQEADTREMLSEVTSRFLPNTYIIVYDPQEQQQIEEIIPDMKNYNALHDKATAYICENFACRKPVNKIGAFREELAQLLNTKEE